MGPLLYAAMSGAKQIQAAQGVHSNNLANAGTTGFRADVLSFSSLPLAANGRETQVYSQAAPGGVDFSPGLIRTTGAELDIAVNGAGFIAVQDKNGNEAYTRAGDLRLSANGILETGAGHPVLGNGGPIAIPPAEKLEIGADGTISIRPLGQTASTLAVLDRIKLVNPDARILEKGGDGLLRARGKTTLDPDVSVTLISGSLESSNVNAVQAMVEMIALAREFEMQVKLMNAAKENDISATQLLKLNQ
jgi:flagellar basal-body rod protein FlgF